MAGFSFKMNDLSRGLDRLEDKADTAIRMYAETGGQKLVSSAKENRKWTDRTGRARASLNSSVAKISSGYRIYLAHGVNYGIYLELAHEKRFAIIPQTIEYVGTFEIIPGFEKLLDRLGG